MNIEQCCEVCHAHLLSNTITFSVSLYKSLTKICESKNSAMAILKIESLHKKTKNRTF